MGKRLAYLIGNENFDGKSGLSKLDGPRNDVEALARILGDQDKGCFIVSEFIDKASYDILPAIDDALRSTEPDDLVLIYYSGHGRRDRSGNLCLATANTRKDALISTSIDTGQLRSIISNSNNNQTILILDCCYSGAVGETWRSSVSDELQNVVSAGGFSIITASTSVQVARETKSLADGRVMGRFTAALVGGIENGAADTSGNGEILLSDLRRYLARTITGQTPQFFDLGAFGDPLISRSPATAMLLLPADILADLESEQWFRRRGAVSALASISSGGKSPAQVAATTALALRLERERDYIVRPELEAVLGVSRDDFGPEAQLTEPPTVSIAKRAMLLLLPFALLFGHFQVIQGKWNIPPIPLNELYFRNGLLVVCSFYGLSILLTLSTYRERAKGKLFVWLIMQNVLILCILVPVIFQG